MLKLKLRCKSTLVVCCSSLDPETFSESLHHVRSSFKEVTVLKNPSCYEKKSKLLRNGALYNLGSNINISVDRNAPEMKR